MVPPSDAPMPPDCPLMELAVLCCTWRLTMPESPPAKVLPGVTFVVAVEAAALAAPSPIKALPISKPRKASSASDNIEPGERETPMPNECRIPSSLVLTFRKAIAHSNHRNRLPETASLPCASTAAAASSSVKAKAAGQYRSARLMAVNRVNRVFFM